MYQYILTTMIYILKYITVEQAMHVNGGVATAKWPWLNSFTADVHMAVYTNHDLKQIRHSSQLFNLP